MDPRPVREVSLSEDEVWTETHTEAECHMNKKTTIDKPWRKVSFRSWTSGLQSCVKINFCF